LFRFISYVGFAASCLATTVWADEPSSEFAALISMQKQPAGTFYVSASLDGHNGALPLLVDTGSSFMVLNEVLLKELKAHGTAEYVHDIEGMMADGSHRTIPIYRLTALRMKPSGSKLGIDATKKLPGEGFKREWPPLIRMDEGVKRKVDALLSGKSR